MKQSLNFLYRITGFLPKSKMVQAEIGIAAWPRTLIIAGGLLFAAIMLAGCGAATPTTRPGAVPREATVNLPTGGPTPKPTPSSTRVLPADSLTPAPTATVTPFPDEARGLVVEVIDGDTIVVVLEGDPPGLAYEVRYIGIDAPPNTPSDPWGVVAYEANRRMTNLKVVNLVRDVTNADDEGRLLRYVYVDNQLMSIILTEQGLARANIVEPDTRFRLEIEEAEARARSGGLGLWGSAPPTPTQIRSQPTGTGEVGTVEPEATATLEPVETGTKTVEPEGVEEPPTGEPSAKGDETSATSTPSEDSSTDLEATVAATPTRSDTANESELQGP